MPVKNIMFQPGVILHEVIVGVFRSSGTTLGAWCQDQGIHPATVASANYGQSGGAKGRALLDKVIDAAGREMVISAYRKRMLLEAERVSEGVAA